MNVSRVKHDIFGSVVEGSFKIDSLSLVLTAGTGIEQDSQKRIGIKSWVTKLLEIIIVCVCASQDTCVDVCVCTWEFLCVCVYVHVCLCGYVFMCVCVCMWK